MTTTTRKTLAESFRGAVVQIPDLGVRMTDWPSATHSDIDELRMEMETVIKRLFLPGKRREKLIAADPGSFAARWWPYAQYGRLLVAAHLSLWLFAWDDETDSAEFSEKINSLDKGQEFRDATLNWIRAVLKIDLGTNEGVDVHKNVAQIPINRLFEPVAEALVKGYNLTQRKILMAQIEHFIRMSGVEQEVQLEQGIPSIESYWQRRRGTSAVLVVLAIHEYTLEAVLPPDVWRNDIFLQLCEETNLIISTWAFHHYRNRHYAILTFYRVNDVLSFKKELAQNQVDSLIPILCEQREDSTQEAVNAASKIIILSAERLENAALALASTAFTNRGREDMQETLMRFVSSCKYACTANLNWSLMSGRYKLGIDSLRGGTSVTL